jgi:hypothetical protein
VSSFPFCDNIADADNQSWSCKSSGTSAESLSGSRHVQPTSSNASMTSSVAPCSSSAFSSLATSSLLVTVSLHQFGSATSIPQELSMLSVDSRFLCFRFSGNRQEHCFCAANKSFQHPMLIQMAEVDLGDGVFRLFVCNLVESFQVSLQWSHVMLLASNSPFRCIFFQEMRKCQLHLDH